LSSKDERERVWASIAEANKKGQDYAGQPFDGITVTNIIHMPVIKDVKRDSSSWWSSLDIFGVVSDTNEEIVLMNNLAHTVQQELQSYGIPYRVYDGSNVTIEFDGKDFKTGTSFYDKATENLMQLEAAA
jgi:hypothetical protein